MNKKSRQSFFKKKKSCPFKNAGFQDVDYKNTEVLSQFITEQGKILPMRVTGVSAEFQRMLKKAIKRARHVALLPFINRS